MTAIDRAVFKAIIPSGYIPFERVNVLMPLIRDHKPHVEVRLWNNDAVWRWIYGEMIKTYNHSGITWVMLARRVIKMKHKARIYGRQKP